jgi:hypothetical protein
VKYVKVSVIEGAGYWLDPEAYLTVLPRIAADLPPGAREFALDVEHYDFFGPRCVKDLKVGRITMIDGEGRLSAELLFVPNQFKHEQELLVRYVDVTAFTIDVTAGSRGKDVWPEARSLDDLQLDEILPHEDGCSHEIQLIGGSVRVVAADLTAHWRTPA